MPEPIVFPLDLDEVREIWITRDVYGRLCGESRLFSQSDIGEALEGLRRARGDIQSLVAEVDQLRKAGGNLRDEYLSEVVRHNDAANSLAELMTARDRAREVHTEFRIYAPCGHRDVEDCIGDPMEIDGSDWTCEAGYLYSVCRECCTHGGDEQTEECADFHTSAGAPDPDGCWPCRTRVALDGESAEQPGEAATS
jgi:hypothetical protein